MIGSKPAWTALLGASALLIASLAFTAPARAEDDGYEPLWDGIGGALGIVPKKDQDSIDYHPRGKLVLPKNNALPPPVASRGQNPAWPKDPDVEAAKQAKLDAQKPAFMGMGTRYGIWRDLTPAPVNGPPITVGATSGHGKAAPLCNVGEKTGSCSGGGGNILKMFGMGDKPLAAGEPTREWLTDPPPGLRAPVGALGSPAPAAGK